jgi:hypothetical protein
MAVRLYVGAFEKDVQEPVRIVLIAGVEIVIHPPSRRAASLLHYRLHQIIRE